MLVKSIAEEEIYGIGHAFGFYDYGEETGMTAAFSGREATADYVCAYVRGMLRGACRAPLSQTARRLKVTEVQHDNHGLKIHANTTCYAVFAPKMKLCKQRL